MRLVRFEGWNLDKLAFQAVASDELPMPQNADPTTTLKSDNTDNDKIA